VLRVALAIVLGAFPLLVAVGLLRWLGKRRHVPLRQAAAVMLGGVVAGVIAVYVEHVVLGWTGLSLKATLAGSGGALLATFLLAAPLEEALKVLVVWPLYSSRALSGPRLGLAYAATAAAGFAAAESVAIVLSGPADWLVAMRVALGVPAHLFFAGFWGYWLGSARRARDKWFSLAWLFSMLLHGVYDHIVFGRGPGFMVAALPLLLAMALFAWGGLREVAPGSVPPASGRGSLLSALPEPPSLRAMRRALRRTDRPLMVHWIGIGTLVTIGVMIACIASAVFVGHRVGIDFAMADEADVRSSGPLVLIGAAILAAFPIAGYLVAKASAATSVLEPALGAGLAIVAVLVLLSATAPVAVVFALAVAPVAFALACGGAWFGLGGQ
jgi:hypothetical protein